MTAVGSLVGDRWHLEGDVREVVNPADLDDRIGTVALASPAVVGDAMDEAAAVWREWRRVDLGRRCAILERALRLLEDRREDVAAVITRENGKTTPESLAEVDGALRDGRHQLEFIAEQGLRGGVPAAEVRYEPVGVYALITPWNFPLATIVRKLIPALALGNTAVVKASEVTPCTPAVLFQVLLEAELPLGVANLILAEGPVAGPVLVDHGSLKGLSFTGSTETGFLLAQGLGGRPVRLQLEMGGKNALVVLADADLDEAADAAVFAAFSVAGQWCTSTSRVVVEDAVHDDLVDRIRERAAKIRIGDGTLSTTTMGPVVSATQKEKVRQAIVLGRSSEGTLVVGGHLPDTVDGRRGHWVEPTIFTGVPPDATLAQEEIFGPVLAILRCDDVDDALRITNGTMYGLACSIYTNDSDRAERFVDGVEVGACHINLPTPQRAPSCPLTGWRASGWGVPEAGPFAREFFTKPRAIYRRIP